VSPFLTIAIILGLTAALAYINEGYVRLQQTIGLMVLALALTVVVGVADAIGIFGDLAGFRTFVNELSLDSTLLNGVLCFMLFAGSINVKARTLGEEKWVILSLAIGATLIGAVLVGLGVWGLLALFGISFGLIYALIFGALISPTDPIAALAILGNVGLPPRLEAVINGESLFNDGVGVVIFSIALTIALGTATPSAGDAIVMFVREVLGGVALGAIAAAIMHHTLRRTQEDYGTQVLLSLSIVALTYAAAEHIEVSGPIATVVLGLVTGNVTMPHLERRERVPLKTFWRAIDESLNAVLFVLIGLHIAVVPLDTPGLPTALAAIAVCLCARWLSVYGPLRALSAAGALKGDTLGLANLLTWGGLRGGLAIAMALSLPDGAQKDIIVYMTYGVVAFSIIVQGLTVARLFSADHLARLIKQ
jgi:Na+:H+ antiporter